MKLLDIISKMKAIIVDKSEQVNEKRVKIAVEFKNDSFCIMPEGYGDSCSTYDSGVPVMLEIWEGELRVLIWADINQEDPTHVISLEGARESKRI